MAEDLENNIHIIARQNLGKPRDYSFRIFNELHEKKLNKFAKGLYKGISGTINQRFKPRLGRVACFNHQSIASNEGMVEKLHQKWKFHRKKPVEVSQKERMLFQSIILQLSQFSVVQHQGSTGHQK